MVSGHPTVATAGVTAADLLVEACGSGDDLLTGTVRDLAYDLAQSLASPSGRAGSAVEAALLCADLATLAACNAAALPNRSGAVAATHLAAGTARALAALAVAGAGAPGDVYAENALRDARSARWKADLAVRQLGETDHSGPAGR